MLSLTALLLSLMAAAVLVNKPAAVKNRSAESAKPVPEKVILNQNDKPSINQGEKETRVCGNGICEDVVGENKESCPRDCSGGI